jgi:hypothetical protein
MISIIGTYASLFGIYATYIQINSVKKISEKTEKALEEWKMRFNIILSTHELSKSIKLVSEIQSYIRSKKYEITLLRLQDLKEILIQNKNNRNIIDLTRKNIYNEIIANLSIDILNIHSSLLKNNVKNIDYTKINENLESLSDKLNEIVYKLKIQ